MANPDCVCNLICIYKSMDLVFVIGVIANLTVVWRTAVDRALKSPTFVAIACLALSDAIFLAMNIAISCIAVISEILCYDYSFVRSEEFEAVVGISWFVSSIHLSFISVVRCFLILYPLKAHVYLTRHKVVIASASLWIAGILIWMVLYALQHYSVFVTTKSVKFEIAVWVLVFFSPVIIMIVMHIMKCRAVERSAQSISSSDQRRLNQYQQMARMILLLVATSLLLPLPRFIFTVSVYAGVHFSSENLEIHLKSNFHTLFLLSNAINPFLYAFISVNFRRSLQRFRKGSGISSKYTSSRGSSSTERNAESKSVISHIECNTHSAEEKLHS